MLISDLRRWPLTSGTDLWSRTYTCTSACNSTHMENNKPLDVGTSFSLKGVWRWYKQCNTSRVLSGLLMGCSENKLSDQNAWLSTLTHVLPNQRQSLDSSQSVTSRFCGEWPRKTPRFLGPPHVCSCVFACTCRHTNMFTHVHTIHTLSLKRLQESRKSETFIFNNKM